MLSKYWNTVKYLKPVQILGRFWFRLYKPIWLKGDSIDLRSGKTEWIFHSSPILMLNTNTFRFLNCEATVDLTSGWNDQTKSALWNYNLHYFDDLSAKESDKREAWHNNYIKRWIEANSIGSNPGWDSYPTSLRIVNWIKWAIGREQLPDNFHLSLVQQTRWLNNRIEYHLQANHLWANAKALLYSAAYFDGPESEFWLRKSKLLIQSQIEEQILEDGGHFELSPMYHAIILVDVLDLLQLGTVYPQVLDSKIRSSLTNAARKMWYWLNIMSHSTNEIGFFNDTTNGISASLSEIKSYANSINVRLEDVQIDPFVLLDKSGYARLQQSDVAIICDVGNIGPNHQPGHAHADSLSFELSIAGEKVFVNSGISTYQESALRMKQRSTYSHNTVEVDGENSSDVWKSFRVAKRADIEQLKCDSMSDQTMITASHNGYKRLKGKVTHCRKWMLIKNSLTIEDSLTGSFKRAIARFHLHPEISVSEVTSDYCEITTNHRKILVNIAEGILTYRHSNYYPEFGLAEENGCLEVHFQSPRTEVRFSW